jgi:predicted nucleic acid-binding Zn ribbon protein
MQDTAAAAGLPIGEPEVYVPSVNPSSRARRRKSAPEPASALVTAVVAKLGGEKRGREQLVFSAFTEIAGPFLRRHSQPDALRDHTLIVRVSSSAVAHHLTLLRGEILAKMAERLPPGTITDIRTRVGNLEQNL